ncbi:MAG: 3-oxoacyl-ACP synthase III family protein, partial [Marinirhabdus sp.]
PSSKNSVDKGEHFFQMNGREVYKTAIDVVPKCISEILKKNDRTIAEVKCLLPHQPSIRILKEVAERVGMPFEKVKTNMDRYANTSGGTIPIILDETLKNSKFEDGDLLLFAAVGAGWTWGTALYKW